VEEAMNREIKFRAWDKKCKVMRQWEWIRNCEFPFISDEWGTHLLDEKVFELMQYTGLKDKNGKEIYEGDIVVGTFTPDTASGYLGQNPHSYEFTGSVVFEHYGFKYLNSNNHNKKNSRNWLHKSIGDFRLSGIVIIGNIYENPELLKGKEQGNETDGSNKIHS
jgi:uncharacterized phage protein (TIGR01671 family)